MTEAAVFTEADPPIPVEVETREGTWPGFVLGWRPDKVYVTYNSGIGLKHLTWVAPAQVRRLPGNDEERPAAPL